MYVPFSALLNVPPFLVITFDPTPYFGKTELASITFFYF